MKRHNIQVEEDSNLLDAINGAGIKDVDVFGICNKQLSCHSCVIHIFAEARLSVHITSIKKIKTIQAAVEHACEQGLRMCSSSVADFDV